MNLKEARGLIEMRSEDYNEVRLQQSLNNQTPLEFKERLFNKNRFIIGCYTLVAI